MWVTCVCVYMLSHAKYKVLFFCIHSDIEVEFLDEGCKYIGTLNEVKASLVNAYHVYVF